MPPGPRRVWAASIGPQAALFDPLLEMADGLLKLLRPDLNPWLKHPVMLVAFAPALDVARLQQPHFLEQFQRADAAVSFQGCLGRALDALLEVAVGWVSHLACFPSLLTSGNPFAHVQAQAGSPAASTRRWRARSFPGTL